MYVCVCACVYGRMPLPACSNKHTRAATFLIQALQLEGPVQWFQETKCTEHVPSSSQSRRALHYGSVYKESNFPSRASTYVQCHTHTHTPKHTHHCSLYCIHSVLHGLQASSYLPNPYLLSTFLFSTCLYPFFVCCIPLPFVLTMSPTSNF